MSRPGMTRHNFYVTDNQMTKLKEQSEKTGYSVSELLRQALELFLSQKAK
jgi:hypothetical protein